PVVAPAPKPAPVVEIAKPQAAASQRVEQILLDVIAEKTGYPTEMLNLDMALDADLGIDSIKRVEILSALQEKLPSAPAIKPEHLGSLRTLRDVVTFLEGAPTKAAPEAIPATQPPPVSQPPQENYRA